MGAAFKSLGGQAFFAPVIDHHGTGSTGIAGIGRSLLNQSFLSDWQAGV
jgi:hypothetical protein